MNRKSLSLELKGEFGDKLKPPNSRVGLMFGIVGGRMG